MKEQDRERMKTLLREALPPVELNPEPGRDLWPAVLRRLDAEPARAHSNPWLWFDWALLAGVAALAVSSPASIPVLLYYL